MKPSTTAKAASTVTASPQSPTKRPPATTAKQPAAKSASPSARSPTGSQIRPSTSSVKSPVSPSRPTRPISAAPKSAATPRPSPSAARPASSPRPSISSSPGRPSRPTPKSPVASPGRASPTAVKAAGRPSAPSKTSSAQRPTGAATRPAPDVKKTEQLDESVVQSKEESLDSATLETFDVDSGFVPDDEVRIDSECLENDGVKESTDDAAEEPDAIEDLEIEEQYERSLTNQSLVNSLADEEGIDESIQPDGLETQLSGVSACRSRSNCGSHEGSFIRANTNEELEAAA